MMRPLDEANRPVRWILRTSENPQFVRSSLIVKIISDLLPLNGPNLDTALSI